MTGLMACLDTGRREPDWATLAGLLPWSAAMAECQQDPVFHQEGDVWTHTVSVIRSLRETEGFHDLPDLRRRSLLAAALLHDVAKPSTRIEEFDPGLGRKRVSHPSHAPKGARMAHALLWQMGEAAELRERVFGLVMVHQRVFHLLSGDDPLTSAIKVSTSVHWADALRLAEADNLGRIAPNTKETSEELQLTRMYLQENSILDAEWAFGSDAARVQFCRLNDRSAFFIPQEPAGSRVVVLSGLPGTGKDTYARRCLADLPQVSLDDLRAELKVSPRDGQGAVVQAATERARAFLRRKVPFVWNATNLSRLARNKVIDLCLAYDAKVEIHALDTPAHCATSWNSNRPDAVPHDVFVSMQQRWEPPTRAEAHAVFRVPPSHHAKLLKAEGDAAAEMIGSPAL